MAQRVKYREGEREQRQGACITSENLMIITELNQTSHTCVISLLHLTSPYCTCNLLHPLLELRTISRHPQCWDHPCHRFPAMVRAQAICTHRRTCTPITIGKQRCLWVCESLKFPPPRLPPMTKLVRRNMETIWKRANSHRCCMRGEANADSVHLMDKPRHKHIRCRSASEKRAHTFWPDLFLLNVSFFFPNSMHGGGSWHF